MSTIKRLEEAANVPAEKNLPDRFQESIKELTDARDHADEGSGAAARYAIAVMEYLDARRAMDRGVSA